MSHHPFPWREPFLQALREYPVVQHACDTVGILRCTAYRTRVADKEFAEAWDEAMESGIDRAEKEAMRRGVHGFEEPVIHKGELAWLYEPKLDENGEVQRDDRGNIRMQPARGPNGEFIPLTVRKHSDALLALVLKARRQAYRVERTELTSPDGSMSPTDDAARHARVAALMARAKARKQAAGGEPEDFSDLA